ncbi:unnamed protein product [Didymodactylos carnosus]|uniref:Integrase catalytic domain-containing protein n=1 Tax=Didymodactylos carnosus TaxID=1234261 RepID=A0A815DDH1_9BILA|nr:unnamed protein product [Didymodactylos carnosus]CAF1300172.1 unnamed protein product [Didymodactylos carnosus]CAF3994540.1 unnamed protein product [Didymodactylos carnosus]CAF4122350.1 unnamed protein product [Didymodactylos carnosus]
MGPYPRTQRGKEFVLVVADYFTRWIEVFPMRSTTALEVGALIVNEVICRYGCPKYILSDNGPQFVAEIFTSICKDLSVKNKYTATYHPQTNMTERVNKTLKQMISQYAEGKDNSWDKELQKLALAIRTSVNESTGETPAFLNLGRDPRLPLDLLIGDTTSGPPGSPDDQKKATKSYRDRLIEDLKYAYQVAREHAQVKKLTQKAYYDRHTTSRQFNKGQLVWVAIPHGAFVGKLHPRWQGPCKILEKITPSTFKIQRLSDRVTMGTVNADRLKPYLAPQAPIKPLMSVTPITPLMDLNLAEDHPVSEQWHNKKGKSADLSRLHNNPQPRRSERRKKPITRLPL